VKRKIICIIFALTIGLSIFAGLTMAAPRVKHEPVVLLGSFSGQASPNEWTLLMETQSSKEALYTISVYTISADILLSLKMPSGYWHNITYTSPLDITTLAAHGARIYTNNDVYYYLMIQGEEDTMVTVIN
jgi:hypothetical protein